MQHDASLNEFGMEHERFETNRAETTFSTLPGRF